MLRRANKFSSQYGIHFNMSKSQFVIFTVDRKFNSAETIECNGVSIKAQCVADHLGNTLYVGLSKAVEKCTRDFNTRVNALIAYFWCAPVDVKYQLFATYCMPLFMVHNYGTLIQMIVRFFTQRGVKQFENYYSSR